MQNDDFLEWSSKYITGIETIDEQHKMLIDMINEANFRLRTVVSRVVVQEIVHDLMSYALYHFETEEELMADHGYAGEQAEDAAHHIQEHRGFSQTVASVQQDLATGGSVTREVLLSFLNNWLINHILNTDMRLGVFLNSRI